MKTFHKIVVLGSPRIGKTTILEEAVYGNKFRLKTHYEPTSEDVYCGLVETDKKSREKVFFYDYAGVDNIDVEALKLYLSFCDAFLLIYAKHDRNSYIKAKELKKNIDKLKEKKDIPIFVLAHQMRTDSQYLIALPEAITWADSEKAYEAKVSHRVTFEIEIGNQTAGKIVIGCFGSIVPKTVANFVAFASENGFEGRNYVGSIFHRVIPNFMIQGGDITSFDGRGSISIYGERFADENFILNHGEPGLLSMANAGKDTNGSQFFITLVPTPWLDGTHVIFGKVLQGMDVVYRIGALPTNAEDKPEEDVKIVKTQVEEVDEVTELE